MKKKYFENYSFVVIDDDKLSRISILRLFKNLGDPQIYSAENGNEAISVLEDRKDITCVVCDFNMPVMHGLQLLKLIRCGQRKIRRNMPVVMLTGYGEPVLVKLAIGLDANTFVLKPVTAETLVPRMQEILCLDSEDYSWLKSPDEYLRMDVDSDIQRILDTNAASQISEDKLFNKSLDVMDDSDDVVEWFIDGLDNEHVLARSIIGSDNQEYVSAGTNVSKNVMTTLKDLHAMNLIGDKVWVRS